MSRFLLGLLLIAGLSLAALAQSKSKTPAPPPSPTHKVGVASAPITPKQNMWMAGYAARKAPSEGIAQDLYAKALAIEDHQGNRLVIVTSDIIGIRREVRDAIAAAALERFNLPPDFLLLNASHTHCGPEYRPRAGREEEANNYRLFFEQTVIDLIGKALEDLAPARLAYAHARAGFAMNRRANYLLPADDPTRRAPNADGPVDHSVPVLLAYNSDDSLKSILFTYACHATSLSSVSVPPNPPVYHFNGDYPGFAQHTLQKLHPSATALFLTGCGGDQNPYPRHALIPGVMPLEFAEHHGKSLAYSVLTAILAGPRPVEGPLRAAIGDVQLTRNNDKPAHNYPVQVIRIGDMITMVALGSEVVVDYSLRLKREIDSPVVWVAGYSNDYSGYIPSRRIAEEGGYEAANDFTLDVEDRIVGKVNELLGQLSRGAH